MWKLSDYCKAWQISDDCIEIEETTPTPAWKIFIKDDVLIVLESALDENEDYILGVSLASFDKASVKKMLLVNTQAGELPHYQTNLLAGTGRNGIYE